MVSNPFPQASGFGNFTNGNFAPDIFVPEALYYLRQISIVDDITTSEYQGSISAMGDTVHIRKQPRVGTSKYTRGTKLKTQNLADDKTVIKIDQGNYYQFELDDVMMAQADVDYETLCAESAAYELKDDYDQQVLADIFASVAAANVEGSSGSELTIGYGAGNDYRPLDAVNRLNTILTENNVPNSGRWFVSSPAFYEALGREVGKFVETQVTGDRTSLIRDKGIKDLPVHGFTMFETNNAVTNASGNPVLLAGHVSAYATAQQLLKTQTLPNPDDFGDIHRGLHVYGGDVLRSTALAAMHVTIGDVT